MSKKKLTSGDLCHFPNCDFHPVQYSAFPNILFQRGKEISSFFFLLVYFVKGILYLK